MPEQDAKLTRPYYKQQGKRCKRMSTSSPAKGSYVADLKTEPCVRLLFLEKEIKSPYLYTFKVGKSVCCGFKHSSFSEKAILNCLEYSKLYNSLM